MLQIRGGYTRLVGGDVGIKTWSTSTSNTVCYSDTSETIEGTASTTIHRLSACTPSSKRYKENIQPLNVSVDSVLQLQPVNFTWKTNHVDAVYKDGKMVQPASDVPVSTGPNVGLIAEDVAKIIPELALYNNNGEIENLDYRLLGVYELAVLKQHHSDLANITNTAKSQQSQIDQLKQENAALKQLVCLDHPGADLCK